MYMCIIGKDWEENQLVSETQKPRTQTQAEGKGNEQGKGKDKKERGRRVGVR